MNWKHPVLVASLALAASSLLDGQTRQSQPTQPDATTGAVVRVAAVRFALSHGFALPSGELIVARENVFKGAHPLAPIVAPEELQSQAVALATAVGRSARTGSAEQLLSCRFSYCAPTTKASVLLVDHPLSEKDRPLTVLIRLYSPGIVGEYDALFSTCTVEVEQNDGVWAGSGFRFAPVTGKLKMPSK